MFGLGKKNQRIDAFGCRLATALCERFPVALEASAGKRKANDKLERALSVVLTDALRFRREENLGIYGKARLFSAFKDELMRRGYSQDFIESTTAALVRHAPSQR